MLFVHTLKTAEALQHVGMSNKWAFIGGILAGIAGVFTAAAISVEMEDRGVSSRDTVGEPEKLALPE